MSEEKMIYAEAISRKLAADNWFFDRVDSEDETMFMIPMGIDNSPGLLIRIFAEYSGSVKIRSRLLKNTAKDKRKELINALNSINTRFRFICFSIDNDGDIFATYDFNSSGEPDEVADITFKMFGLFTNIVNEAFPIIAKALWN